MYYVTISTLFAVFIFIIVRIAAMQRSSFPTGQRTQCGMGRKDSSLVEIHAGDQQNGRIQMKMECLAVLIPQDDLPTSTHLMVTSSTCAHRLRYATKVTADCDGLSRSVHKNAYMRGNLALLKLRLPLKFTERTRPACLPGDGDTNIPDSGYTYTISEWAGHYSVSAKNVTRHTTTQLHFVASAGNSYTTTIPTGTPYLVYDQAQQRHTLWGIANCPLRHQSINHLFASIPAYLPYIKQLMSGDETGWQRESTS